MIAMALVSVLAGCCPVSPVNKHPAVNIESRSGYYYVTIDMTQGYTHHEIGMQYSKAVFEAVPSFIWRLGVYANTAQIYYGFSTEEIEKRIENIRSNVLPAYRDELDGFVDGYYSAAMEEPYPELFVARDIIYFYQLMPDIARETRCSAFAVWGTQSAEGSTICHRNLDWFGGILGELAGIQAITKYIYADKNVYTIGGLGHLGCVTGINGKNGNFGAILDSDIDGTTYYSEGCRSYNFDLRYALETFDTKEQIADYLKDPAKDYTYSHLIFLADATNAMVLENNVAGAGLLPKRDTRMDTSVLQPFITWPYTEMLGVVNCFMLAGQVDNYNQMFNTQRWALMKQKVDAVTAAGHGLVTFSDVQGIMTSYWQSEPRDFEKGDIYNTWTYQMMTYIPAKKRLEVFFKPNRDDTPTPPPFTSVPIE